MPEPHNYFDEACRYLLRRWGVPLLAWLLGLRPADVEFVEWLDTRQIPWPGHPGRICDTVAHLRDPRRGGVPVAAVVEFQIDPDELMTGRGLVYLGEVWLACKPTEHRGDRFDVGLVVVNLRGRGNASRRMTLGGAAFRTELCVQEWNFETLPAARVLRQVKRGKAPRGVLPWIPLFSGGNDDDIIKEWRRLADADRIRSCGLRWAW